MKPAASKLGTALLVIISAPLALCLIVIVSPMILAFALLNLTGRTFCLLRSDPKHRTPDKYKIYSNSTYPETVAGLKEYFNEFLTLIQDECQIKSDTVIKTDNIENGDDTDSTSDGSLIVTLSAALATEHGKASIKMEAIGYQGKDGMLTSLHDEDVPPYLKVAYVQQDGPRTVFFVSTYDSLEFLVASLKHGQTISDAGQVWTKVRDGLYMVNYTVRKSDKSDRIGTSYGYRHAFSNKRAREYFFDEKA